MVIKLLKPTLALILAFYLVACGTNERCSNLDYESLELDSTQLLNDQIFIHETDTIILKSRSSTLNKIYSKPSFISMDECANGIYLSYDCDELNFEFNAYFIVTDHTKEIEACYYSSLFETLSFSKLKNLDDIDTTIYTNTPNGYVVEFYIENGLLESWRDYHGDNWHNSFQNPN